MKPLFIVFCSSLLLYACAPKEKPPEKFVDPVAELFDSSLAPFYHGVASGDPLADRVIIWTRVTPETVIDSIPVIWEVAETRDFTTLLKSDSLTATAAHDYTVKVDVPQLQPGKTYYYRFHALGKTSATGRTKTTPVTSLDSLKFAVVSCSNWEWGYFNAYDKIADHDDLDAVVHLGDYIYEYGRGGYGDTTIRKNLPPYEIVSLSDYRTRHSQYRLDKGLRRMSERHPLIAIWDDHEVANNVYSAGAQNHQPDKEGDFEKRKAAAVQAYYEWLPIREDGHHYRSFSYGSLADLIMLDERLEGRTRPVDSITAPNYLADRTMLGADQLTWLENSLQSSTATWKVLGNQVMFSDIELSVVYPNMPRNLDSWDGYPTEKKKLKDFILNHQLKDLIFLTGDTHASWAIEVATEVKKTYNPKTSAGAFAIELGTTSVSSANDNEYHATDTVKRMEAALLKMNPHIKYLNARDHGYLLLSLYPDRMLGEWYYLETLRQPESNEFLGKKVTVTKGTVQLK
jgi:alkaline phosphatase D